MKDGRVKETGTHVELMKIGGEYSKLYNAQAGVFAQDSNGISNTNDTQLEPVENFDPSAGVPVVGNLSSIKIDVSHENTGDHSAPARPSSFCRS